MNNKIAKNVRSFVLIVIAPFVFFFLYLAFVASDQFETGFKVQVKKKDQVQSLSLGQMFGMFSGGGAGSDSYALIQFVESHELIERLDKRIQLVKMYRNESVDILFRMTASAQKEDIEKYWKKKITVYYEPTTETVVFSVKAFSPDDAKKIADAVLEESEIFLNDLSEKNRSDQLKHSIADLESAERHLRDIERQLLVARKANGVIDSSRQVSENIARASKIRSEIEALTIEYNVRSKFSDTNSPVVRSIESRLNSAKNLLKNVTGEIDNEGATQKGLVSAVAELEELEFRRTVASKRLEAAYSAFLSAQKEASRQQLYVDMIVSPTLAEVPVFPRVIFNSFVFFITTFFLWLFITLLFESVKDHVRR